MTRFYLSGPMTGMPGMNFPAFHAEADRLRFLGYDVVNPAELNPDPNASWHDCMRRDLAGQRLPQRRVTAAHRMHALQLVDVLALVAAVA